MSFTEWCVVGDAVIAADQHGNSLCVDIPNELGPLFREMAGEGSSASTRALLDGAIARAFEGYDPTPMTMSLPRYALDLVSAFHNSTRTPGHFRRAAKTLAELGRPEIAAYLEKHAREETGHDRLALKDLSALGYPAERLVARLTPEGVTGLVELFDELVDAAYPIGVIGYSYAFERTANIKGQPEVDAIVALCPPGIDAARFLRSHSSLGSEATHVDDLVAFIADLPASDRMKIVRAVHQTACVLAERGCWHRVLTDQEIETMLGDAMETDERVDACRRDALGHLDNGDAISSVAAMISDVRKIGLGQQYDHLISAGVKLRDPSAVRQWLDNF